MHTIWQAQGSLLRVDVNHQGLWLVMEVKNPQNPKIEVLLKEKPGDFIVILDYVLVLKSNFEAKRLGNGRDAVYITLERDPIHQIRIEFQKGFSLVTILTLKEVKSLRDALIAYWS